MLASLLFSLCLFVCLFVWFVCLLLTVVAVAGFLFVIWIVYLISFVLLDCSPSVSANPLVAVAIRPQLLSSH